MPGHMMKKMKMGAGKMMRSKAAMKAWKTRKMKYGATGMKHASMPMMNKKKKMMGKAGYHKMMK